MLKLSQKNANRPVLLLHGGAGPYKNTSQLYRERQDYLRQVVTQAWPAIVKGQTAIEAATHCVELLEASPLFNAGLGAVIQSDGMARLSASLMDSEQRKFSGIHLATHIIHPSKLAYALQAKSQSVVGPLGAQLLARELGIPPQNPVIPEKVRQWATYLKKPKGQSGGTGTVGAVVFDQERRLAAATSTGGSLNNSPDRISDSATVAGNYATAFAAIGCTGIGEQIVNDGVAVRLETRVRDDMTMIQASDKVFEEACNNKYEYGWVSVDREGNWAMYSSTTGMPCAAMSCDLDSLIMG